jgi:hypothetical protein
MADTLVQRLTGQATADAVSAEIGLVMTDTALLAGDDTPAELGGFGPIPAALARHITRQVGDRAGGHPDAGAGDPADHSPTGEPGDATEPGAATEPGEAAGTGAAAGTGEAAGQAERARVFLRRLFTDPATGIITDCDPRRRRFDGALAKLLIYRDQHCRDRFCDAPIRHLDHIQTHATGGPTTPANGRGVCERGNHVKQMPGWTVRLIDPTRHLVETTTPTGHTHRSVPPPAPGMGRAQVRSPRRDRAGPPQ